MIPITKPVIGREELEIIQEPLKSGWLVQGDYVRQFEEAVAAFCGVKHAVAASSCTTALHLALMASGIGSDDRVLIPSFTFVATANAVEHTGARPLFVDIDANSFNMSMDALEKCLCDREEKKLPMPKAVIPVHLFGLAADMPKLMALSEKYRLTIIEDAACAIGSKIQDRFAGTFGSASCFSFHPRKLITTGEGGMVLTNDSDIDGKCRILRDHGAAISDHVRHQYRLGDLPDFSLPGYNYRMTDLQGALGTTQLNKLTAIIGERQRLAANYKNRLRNIDWLRAPAYPPGYHHTFQSYVCRIGGDDQDPDALGNVRRRLMNHLKESGIATTPGTHAVHLLDYYRKTYDLLPTACPNAWRAHHQCITLPLYVGLTEDEQSHVVKSIQNFNADFS